MTTLQSLINNKPELVNEKYSIFSTESGPLLLFDNRVIIPDDLELRCKIVQQYHDNPLAGHPGEQETYQLVKKHTYWPRMNTFIRNYIKGCSKCQQFKINRHPMNPPPKSDRPSKNN